MTGRTRNAKLSPRLSAERLDSLNRLAGTCSLCSRRIDGAGALHVECAARAGRCPACGRDTATCRCPQDGAA